MLAVIYAGRITFSICNLNVYLLTYLPYILILTSFLPSFLPFQTAVDSTNIVYNKYSFTTLFSRKMTDFSNFRLMIIIQRFNGKFS